jgi:hypothetical protein
MLRHPQAAHALPDERSELPSGAAVMNHGCNGTMVIRERARGASSLEARTDLRHRLSMRRTPAISSQVSEGFMARPRGGGASIPLAYQGVTSPIVRVQIVCGPTQHYAEVAAYVAYLAKHGKGEDGGAGEHFDRHGPDVEIPAFVARCMRAPWVFKVMVCPPADHSTALPLQEYAQSWMLQVEADLGCRLDWVGGAHYDTDTPHVQFLWNGRTEAGIIVQLDRGYLTHGLRARAAEILALYGGY